MSLLQGVESAEIEQKLINCRIPYLELVQDHVSCTVRTRTPYFAQESY